MLNTSLFTKKSSLGVLGVLLVLFIVSLILILGAIDGNTFLTALKKKNNQQVQQAAVAGVSYYVDCVAGNDANSGISETAAWKTLAKANTASLNPGDNLLLKRGCQWTGPLSAKWSGTSSAPILIGAYGSGSLPHIRNTDSSGEVVKITGTYQTIENLEASNDPPAIDPDCTDGAPTPAGQPKGWRVGFSLKGSFNTLRYSKAHENTTGVYMAQGSNNNKVFNNELTNNTYMSVLTPVSVNTNDDGGAAGIILNGDDNEIAYNYFSGNNACTYDYGPDGISVEVFKAHRNNIHHNKTNNDLSFAELGGDSARKTEDTTIAYNLYTNTMAEGSPAFVVARGSGVAWGPTWRTKVYHNTAYVTDSADGQGVICHAGCSADILTLKNNIIWANWKVAFADAPFDEGHNIYWSTGGSPLVQGFTIASTSKKVDPQFVNVGSDFHLRSTSPAVDAAISDSVTAGFTADLDNKTVPIGSSLDIGAYEYASVSGGTTSITIAAVGDMNPSGNTSTSSPSGKNGAAISAALADGTVDAFLGLGDFQYSTGYCYDYVNYWNRLWSGAKSGLYWISAPNHDWEPGRNEDLDNFMNGQCSGDTIKSAINAQRGFIENGEPYSFDLGNWHFAMISTALWRYDTSRANQVTVWLDGDLAAAKASGKHLAVAYHDPYFTSKTSSHDREWNVKPWVDIMDKWDVRLTLSGSQHNYERSCPVTKDDVCVADSDPNGMTAFQVSTGGIGLRDFVNNPSFIVKRFTGTWGWLQLTLNSDGSFSWQFNAVEGPGSDSGFRVAPGGVIDDTEAPTAPTNLSATSVIGNQVDLSWTASTDNYGVAGYEIFRGGVKIDTTSDTNYSDQTTSPNTTYGYQVRAFDFAGLKSDFSNTETITTPNIQTLVFKPTDDATIKQDSPTSNFGSAARLEVDGSPVQDILLKFDVSGAGTGSIMSAKLRLHNIDQSDSGGNVKRVTDNSWSEDSVTWGSAPAASGSVGSFGSVSPGNWYEMDAGSVVTGDGMYGFRIDSTSSNGADYSSQEGSVPPELVLTTVADPNFDSDLDGYTNTAESFMGTDPLLACGVNAWPPDFNDDSVVHIDDVAFVAARFGAREGDPSYTKRAELASQDGVIQIDDVSKIAGAFGTSCNAP